MDFGGLPFGFGGMPGMGGMPGGGRGRRREEKKDDDPEHTKLYEVLGVEKAATGSQVKKAYMKKARRMHPDKGGDPEKFKELQSAYDILKDEEKRELYNEHGRKAAEEGEAPRDMSSMFGGMFGGGRGRPQGMKKGKAVVHPLKLSLEQLYSGITRRLRMTRQVVLSKDSGELCVDLKAACKKCHECQGSGVKMVHRQIGPGMIQQMQTRCGSCAAAGWTLKPGWVRKERTEELKVDVEKGAKHGQKIKLSEMGDMVPGQFPGDVIFQVVQKDHGRFKRKGADLLLEHSLTLREALCGFEVTVEHLDGRTIRVRGAPGEGTVIAPNSVKCVVDEGMPVYGEPFNSGRLFIHFNVQFPKNGELSEDQVTALNAVLGGGPLYNGTAKSNGTRKPKKTSAVDAEAAARQRAQLDKWRSTKISQWNKPGHKLRKKFPERARLDEWMDQQCDKAMAEYAAKQGGGGTEDDGEDDDDNLRYLEHVDLKEFGVGDDNGHGRSALDSDDEDEGRGGARQVQCAQQ